MSKIQIGIIGAAGYTAGELIRILINHPEANLKWIQSESQAGEPVHNVHKDLIGESDLKFSGEIKSDVDLVFLCKGHGESKKILEANPSLFDRKIIDLSQDYRLKGDHDFVYGLPEINREIIKKSDHIANPGCFATAIQLALLPIISSGRFSGPIHISGITGSTGAGQKLTDTSHFSWRSNNASAYKVLKHQHLLEVGQTFNSLNFHIDEINFVPYRGAFTRGIIITSYLDSDLSHEEINELYNDFYKKSQFTHSVKINPDIKSVVNSNKCLVFPESMNGKAVVISVVDNLLKGASGQAVQNMNLIMGLPEDMGLRLKTSAF